MKKTFPIEDIISFTTGRLISLGHQEVMSGPMHDVAAFVLELEQIDPSELMECRGVVISELCRQHPFLNGFELNEPKAGWESLAKDEPLKAYVQELHNKLGKKTLEITSAPGMINPSIRIRSVFIQERLYK